MSSIELQYEHNANDLLSVLPSTIGFCCQKVDDCVYELRAEECVIQLAFERYDPSSVTVSLIDPKSDPAHRNGMAFWILRQLRGATGLSKTTQDPFKCIGRILVEKFSDLLTGDFSIRRDYDQIEGRILDRLFEVRALPLQHLTRIRFENQDLRWLDDLERKAEPAQDSNQP